MTLTPHPELPGYYVSSNGDWAFSIKPDEDGSVETAETAIAAWTEWRDFLRLQEEEPQAPLF